MAGTFLAHPTAERDSVSLDRPLEVLVAEDNRDGAESLAHILELAGHNVRVVFDGQAAVASVLIDPPDVAVMDIGLPRMDGWEAARRIRQGLAGRPCLLIALTGYDRPTDRGHSREAGFEYHIAKPCDPEALVALLEMYRTSAPA